MGWFFCWMIGWTSLAQAGADSHGIDIPRVTSPIVVDGVLDEAAWTEVQPLTDFTRYIPTRGGPHDSHTEVRIAQDEKTLYIGIRVSGADAPVARIAPREDINNDDQIGIYIDPLHDGRGGYIFYFNARGIQQDARYAYGNWYSAWNTVVYSEATLHEDGYVLEVGIPYRSLRYPPTNGEHGQEIQTWGVMVTRKIPNEGIKLAWPELQPNHPRMFVQAAEARGIQPPKQGSGVELMPVLAVGHALTRETPEAPLVWAGRELPVMQQVRPGLDVRVALTPDMGVAATINPDFSQVEGDIKVVNLNQRFDVNYPEQRPFFLTGLEAFADNTGSLTTRSMAEPVYGLKLAGKQGVLGIGLMNAIDRSPGASVNEAGTPGFGADEVVDRLASTTFLRTRFDVVDKGYIGVSMADKRMLTAVGGLGPVDGSPAPESTGGTNDLLVVDTLVPLAETWTISGHVGGSITGDDAQSLMGTWEGLSVRRSPPVGTGGGVSVSDLSPDFRNEVGYLPQAGITVGTANLYHTVRLGDGKDTLTPSVAVDVLQERNGDAQRGVTLKQAATLKGNHYPSVKLDLRDYTEGGAEVRGWLASVGYTGRVTHWFTLTSGVDGGSVIDFGLLVPASTVSAVAEATLRPTTRLRLDTYYVRQWYHPEALSPQKAARIYSRMNYQITREWGVRVVGTTSTGSEIEVPSRFYSMLLTWLQSPGTEAYLGASWNVNADETGLQEQYVFAKVSRLFRL